MQKREYFLENQKNYNTILIGDSWVNRNINPLYFDEGTKCNTATFNFGADATYFDEELEFLYNLIPELDETVKTIVVGSVIKGPTPLVPSKDNLLSKTTYFRTLSLLFYHIRYYKDNLSEIKSATKAYFANLFAISQRKDIIKYFSGTIYFIDKGFQHDELAINHGYYPLDKQRGVKHHPNLTKGKLEARKNNVETINNITFKEELYFNNLEKLNALCLKHNITLKLLYFPNKNGIIKHLVQNSSISVNNIIDCGTHINFPEYFKYDNYHDTTHLNEEGAKKFSIKLGRLYCSKE